MIRLELNDTEQMDLQLEARRAIGRVSERIHFVLLSGQGNSPPEIGDLMGYEAATVRSWLQAYLENGAESTAPGRRDGGAGRTAAASIRLHAGDLDPKLLGKSSFHIYALNSQEKQRNCDLKSAKNLWRPT